jgi:hypothetical protein
VGSLLKTRVRRPIFILAMSYGVLRRRARRSHSFASGQCHTDESWVINFFGRAQCFPNDHDSVWRYELCRATGAVATLQNNVINIVLSAAVLGFLRPPKECVTTSMDRCRRVLIKFNLFVEDLSHQVPQPNLVETSRC